MKVPEAAAGTGSEPERNATDPRFTFSTPSHGTRPAIPWSSSSGPLQVPGGVSRTVPRGSPAETGVPAWPRYLRHPAHEGIPRSSRSVRIESPFLTSAAMIAGLPS